MVLRDERDDTSGSCADCGAELRPDDRRTYDSGFGVTVCWSCALARGGVFDAARDQWAVAPNVANLPDERRPHP